MPWPIPTAKTIAERQAAGVEAEVTRTRPETDPLGLSRAVRSVKGVIAQILRVVALEIHQVHDHLTWSVRMWFPDTATGEFIARHADIRGVKARPATLALGQITIEGTPGAVLPAELEFADAVGTVVIGTTGAVLDAAGFATIPVIARDPGPAGNIEAGIRLAAVLPNPAIARVTIAGTGLKGGSDEAGELELQVATLDRIRQPPHGGAGFDYPTWLKEQFDVRAVKVAPNWIGRGSVGVIVAMTDGDDARSPTPDEIEAMLVHLGRPSTNEGVRPVTAHVVMVAAIMVAIPITVRLRPDSADARLAVEAAWSRFVRTIGDADDTRNTSPIGALIERSRISEAISAASGEYAHDLVEPAQAIQLFSADYPLPGPVTWAAPL